ncbi:MAG: ATP-binding protein [Nanoarchaeota archaeon]|nr:ATP-binding protein [Nanoarchaeota archaeon]
MKKLTWYNEMGFFNNPFSIKPAAFHNTILGYDDLIDQMNQKIGESNILLLGGKYGTGKTSILKMIINEFKGKKRVIYYNCNNKEGPINFDKLLTNLNFFRRIFRIKKKNMIILLDEAQDLDKKDILKIENYYEQGFFKSVLLVSQEKISALTPSIKKKFANNQFMVRDITTKKAIEIIRKRIGDIDFISDKNLTLIFNKNKNTRAFLKNCEDVFRCAYGTGENEVTEVHIKQILG